MARKIGGACAIPKQIRTDVDCRTARPKFDNRARSPAKISDVTGGGLYLFVTNRLIAGDPLSYRRSFLIARVPGSCIPRHIRRRHSRDPIAVSRCATRRR